MKGVCRIAGRFAPAVLLGLVMLTAGEMRAQDRPPDQLRTLSREELDVVKVLTMQERAWNEGNIDKYASAFKNSPETLFISRSVSHGFEDMLNDYKKNYPNKEAMGTLAFSDLEPKVLDENFAVIVGHYHLDRTKKAGGVADGAFSLVLEKTKEGWKIIVDHTT